MSRYFFQIMGKENIRRVCTHTCRSEVSKNGTTNKTGTKYVGSLDNRYVNNGIDRQMPVSFSNFSRKNRSLA